MESTEIGREAKVYESLWSGGNESRSSGFYFPVYNYICRFTLKEQMMEFVIALLEPFSFNNKFLHSNENRCVCIHRK